MTKNNENKAIVYVRVSSQSQIEGTSLEGQKEACLTYAENKGFDVAKVFVERGESATAADRTELLNAIEYCREARIKFFVVWKVDRFARNITDHFTVRAKLMQYGTTLHSVTELLTDDPQGKLMETMLAGFAEFENAVRKQRCEAGMQRKVREGIWPWKPPLGYIHSKRPGDRRKNRPDQIDKERFALIQKGLKIYTKGNYSINGLTKLFNKWGLRARSGKKMYKQIVERMLTDKFYCGILVDPWTGEDYQGLHKPMIRKDEYYKIQGVKQAYSNGAVNPRTLSNPDFPLRGIVKCGMCGGELTGSWSTGRNKKYAYYRCYNRKCKFYANSIKKRDIETKFMELLKQVEPEEKFLKLFEATVLDKWENMQGEVRKEHQNYDRKIKKLEEQKSRLLKMRMDGELTKDEFLEQKEIIENQVTIFRISGNETEIEELDLETAMSYVNQFIFDLARQWQDMNIRQKQRLQKLVFPKGLKYNIHSGSFGTVTLSLIFRLNREFSGNKSLVVAPTGHV